MCEKCKYFDGINDGSLAMMSLKKLSKNPLGRWGRELDIYFNSIGK